jgi:hypothetical protein
MTEPINPYASPQALEPLHQRPTSAGQPIYARPYESARGKTTALVWASRVTIVFQLVMVVSFAMQLSMLYGAKSGGGLDQATANANDMRQLVITGFLVLAVLTYMIILFVWVYATHSNLPSLGATNLDFTPGWAVGWFFVPIMNFVKPYQVVSEIWHKSQPNPLLGREPTSAALLGWWWGLRICSYIAEQGLKVFSRNANTVDLLIAVSWIAIVGTILIDIPMVTCQIFMARSVQRFQDDRHELVTAQRLASSINPGESPFAARE